jgi:hypothetical protein
MVMQLQQFLQRLAAKMQALPAGFSKDGRKRATVVVIPPTAGCVLHWCC